MVKAGHDVHFLETSSEEDSFQFPKGITNHFMHIPTRVPKDLSEMWKGFSEPEVLVELFSIGDEAVHSVMKNASEQIKEVMSTEWDVVFSDDLFAMGGFGMALRNSRINRKPYIMYSTTIMLQLYGWEQALCEENNFNLIPVLWKFLLKLSLLIWLNI
ncbi:unnamed protein product [Anisakis simplex]|uniref:Uncharacterized protein n=1 Tax=Anisakis simplex TaxID=6269 RepID=A0A3P6Q128_ANISI|nr:unnamed protein product [Anisakis simplex]